MPNWCSNKIVVEGKPVVVKQFIQENFKTNKYPYKEDTEDYAYILDFEQFNPTPIDEQTGEIISEWYSWRLDNWGCKWSPSYEQDIYLTITYDDENKEPLVIYDEAGYKPENDVFTEEYINNLNVEDGVMKLEVNCYCETPWGPPEGMFVQWYEKYKETGLEISMKFYEPGCEVLGELYFSGNDYADIVINSDNRKEWVEYLLNEGWENRDSYIDDCMLMIEEMHDTKEEVELITNKVVEILKTCKTDQAASLIADIQDKYFKWLNEYEPKGDELNGSCEK